MYTSTEYKCIVKVPVRISNSVHASITQISCTFDCTGYSVPIQLWGGLNQFAHSADISGASQEPLRRFCVHPKVLASSDTPGYRTQVQIQVAVTLKLKSSIPNNIRETYLLNKIHLWFFLKIHFLFSLFHLYFKKVHVQFSCDLSCDRRFSHRSQDITLVREDGWFSVISNN